MKRDNCSRELAQKKIAAQMPLDSKRKMCQYVVGNSGSREETAAQVTWPSRSLLENPSVWVDLPSLSWAPTSS